uniref:G_PROTEIN_RECEP_F1_2 domain-containing protein n=1 Tax=Steinernema glaseri TaxID=37863 RepID=A0A1I7ZXR4_9BILA
MSQVEKGILLGYIQLGLTVLSLTVNGFVLTQYTLKRLDVTQHLNMIFVKLILEFIYAIFMVFYSACIVVEQKGLHKLEEFIYLSGNMTASLQVFMALVYFFVTLDRHFAMKKPIIYSQYHNCYVRRASITLGIMVFLCAFFLYAVTRCPSMGAQSSFDMLVTQKVHTSFKILQLLFYVMSIVFTVICSLRLKPFLKKKRAYFMGTFVDSVKTANKCVMVMTCCVALLIVAPLSFEVVKTIGSLEIVDHSAMFADMGYLTLSTISGLIFYCVTRPQCKTTPSPAVSYI